MRDFQETAAQIVRDRPDLAPCLPAIEKELLHLEVLRAMHDEGLLRGMTFKGGTCLRLCHGAERLSEDLDFSGERISTMLCCAISKRSCAPESASATGWRFRCARRSSVANKPAG